MKTVFSSLVALSVVFSFGTSALAAEQDTEQQKIIELIEQTNKTINEKIEKAIADSEQLQSQYLTDVEVIENGNEVVNLENQREQVVQSLNDTNQDEKKAAAAQEKLNKINVQLATAQAKVNTKLELIKQKIEKLNSELISADDNDVKKLQEQLTKLENSQDEQTNKYNKRTEKYINDLDNLIHKLDQDTSKLSVDILTKARAQGVEAESSWVQAQFGSKLVWIDPIRIVGVR